MNANGIVWTGNFASGTHLRKRLEDLDLDALEAASGIKATGPEVYWDSEAGYDGWELAGTFNGQAFTVYTRWGVVRMGGTDDLDVAGLEAELRKIAGGQR